MKTHTLRSLSANIHDYYGHLSINRRAMMEDGLCICGGNLIVSIVEENRCSHGIGRQVWAATCIDCEEETLRWNEIAACCCFLPF